MVSLSGPGVPEHGICWISICGIVFLFWSWVDTLFGCLDPFAPGSKHGARFLLKPSYTFATPFTVKLAGGRNPNLVEGMRMNETLNPKPTAYENLECAHIWELEISCVA